MLIAKLRAVALDSIRRMRVKIQQSTKTYGDGNKFSWGNLAPHRFSLAVCGHNNTVVFEEGVRAQQLRIVIMGSDNTLHVGAGCNLEACTIEFWGKRCSIRLGANTQVIGGYFAAAESDTGIEVGSGCLFAAGVEVRTGDGHAIYDTMTNERVNPSCSVSIGDRVWLASRVRVNKGASIPPGCVVAADSLVNKPLPEPHAVYAGCPATLRKNHIVWEYSLGGRQVGASQ